MKDVGARRLTLVSFVRREASGDEEDGGGGERSRKANQARPGKGVCRVRVCVRARRASYGAWRRGGEEMSQRGDTTGRQMEWHEGRS